MACTTRFSSSVGGNNINDFESNVAAAIMTFIFLSCVVVGLLFSSTVYTIAGPPSYSINGQHVLISTAGILLVLNIGWTIIAIGLIFLTATITLIIKHHQ